MVVNKVDKENCTPEEEEWFWLDVRIGGRRVAARFPNRLRFCQKQLDDEDWKVQTENVEPLLDMVLGTPKVGGHTANAHRFPRFSSYTGRIAIGRLQRGKLTADECCFGQPQRGSEQTTH